MPIVTKNRNTPGTPFITDVAKEVYGERKMEKADQAERENRDIREGKREIREPKKQRNVETGIPITQSVSIPNPSTLQPTLKLEMFAQQPPPQRPMGVYNPYMPVVELTGNKRFSQAAFNHLFAPTSAVSCGPNVRIPMQQVYNINLPGPTGGHVEMSKIYEDVLPGKDRKLTSTTLGERLQTWDFVRQILIQISDGEDISLDNSGQNSLMSYIKFMELNPNYYSPIFSNPYKGLPYGLLIYRSCFPIRVDEGSQSIVCARNSIGLNIRLYSLSIAEYYSYKFRQVIYKEYDVWRELAYYEYVRERILKKKQSPNFPLLYAFFLCPNRNIDFFSLKSKCITQKDRLTSEYQKFVQVHTLYSQVQPSNEIIRPLTLPEAAKKIIAKLPDEIDPALQAYSGSTLILVTEAPHQNLYQWASRIYEPDGVVRKMINHGYHDEKVWYGVLFQIVSALYVLQIHGIYIRDMTITDNIYIKDLQSGGKAAGYWKWVIDGITYYVPNYGYVVYIDTNYKDIIPAGTTIERCKREYKIYTSDIIGKRYKIEDIRRKVYENYRCIVNTNSFSKEHTQNKVFRPPESIMKLLESMMADPEQNLGRILANHFHLLLNNRIGTLLRKDLEIPNIRDITTDFKRGDMAIEVLEENLYKWCLVLEVKPGGIIQILTKSDPKVDDYIKKDVRMETLKQYSTSEKIEQNPNPDINLSEDELLETYVISIE